MKKLLFLAFLILLLSNLIFAVMPTATPTAAPTPAAAATRAGRVVQLTGTDAGLQKIYTGPCYLAGYQSDTRGTGGTITVYDAATTNSAGAGTYRFIILPAENSNFTTYGVNRAIIGGFLAPYFERGLVISRTAENMAGAFYIYTPK